MIKNLSDWSGGCFIAIIVILLFVFGYLGYKDEHRFNRSREVNAYCLRAGYPGGFKNYLGDEYCNKRYISVSESPYIPFKDAVK